MNLHDKNPFICSFDLLEARLGSPGLKVIDASWYLPAQKRDARAEFAAAHIPGAVFFDLDAVVDPDSSLPHTLPTPEVFAAAAAALGLSETDTIVVYDGPGMFSAPRVWWMLRIFGARHAYVLDGGFDRWKAEARPVTDATPDPEPAVFSPALNDLAVMAFDAMRQVAADGSVQIADARSAGRFAGTEPEPRAGMRSGHMPGALNVPFATLVDGGRLKDADALRDVLEAAGIDLSRPVVTTCGSGVTAAVITLALQSLGHRHNMLYDGSWAEWGGRADTPIETG